jgi:hypothetical protein
MLKRGFALGSRGHLDLDRAIGGRTGAGAGIDLQRSQRRWARVRLGALSPAASSTKRLARLAALGLAVAAPVGALLAVGPAQVAGAATRLPPQWGRSPAGTGGGVSLALESRSTLVGP